MFLLCGLWHGAAWNFIFWGLFHGFFLSGESFLWGQKLRKIPKVLQHFYAIVVVMAGWVLFRCETLSQVAIFFNALVGLGKGNGEVFYVGYYIQNDTILCLVLGVIFATPIFRKIEAIVDKKREMTSGASGYALEISSGVFQIAMSITLLFVCTLFLSSQTHNPFIYFRF